MPSFGAGLPTSPKRPTVGLPEDAPPMPMYELIAVTHDYSLWRRSPDLAETADRRSP